MSQTCANCGITYAAYFDHPERCPAFAGGLHGTGSCRPGRGGSWRSSSFPARKMMDVDQAAKAMRDEEMMAEIEDFLEGFNQPTYRGMRVDRVRVYPGRASMAGVVSRGIKSRSR